MVEWQLQARGIRDPLVLGAMGTVPREEFVGRALRHDAYADHPLPIGDDQTISQPYVVGLMLQAAELRTADRVLEVGTGSGYVAAVLGRIAREVWSIERMPQLATTATSRLARLGHDNVHIVQADGTLGLAAHAPYDAIIVSAAGPSAPPALLDQLADGAKLVMPVEQPNGWQQLAAISQRHGKWHSDHLGSVRFVRLIGEYGWR